MIDRRFHAANERVAARDLSGIVQAEKYVDGWSVQVMHPVLDLCAAPAGPRDRQLLLGAVVTVFEDYEGWSFVQAADGYVGYVVTEGLGKLTSPDHMVATVATHAYEAEDFKSPNLVRLPFGARVKVLDERRKFFETTVGFIPKTHLRPTDRPFEDPATIAQMHFGVPYLWGGNSTNGIDCSGLVAAAIHACGQACPADSDLQRNTLGESIPEDAPHERGDLVFWKGHVGMMVDSETLIHANAHHMATRYEPIDRAIARIAAQGDGPVLVRRRLPA